MRFKYVAMAPNGRETEGVIDAENQTAALTQIREQGYFPTKMEEVSTGAAKRGAKAKAAAEDSVLKMELKMPAFLSRVKQKQLMVLTRQLSTLVNAGLPLIRGLSVLQRQERNALLKKTLGEMIDAIQSGSTFAEALAQHPRIFNRLYVNMVKAGEVGGVLDLVLERLAEFMEKAARIKGKVISAMVYPVVVVIMAGLIVTFLMIVIIPKFQEIFSDLLEGKELPMLTQMVLNVSKGFTTQLPWVIIGIVAIIVVSKLAGISKMGRYVIDRIKLGFPLFGTLTRKTAIARFARTLGTLMTSGVPILQALNIVRDTAGNEVISRAVTMVHDSVKEGENMAPPIEASGVFPAMAISMIEVGEETGEVPAMLMKIADAYDEDVDNTVAGLTSIIEPILIIFLALIVGVIVIALFLPLVSIIGQLSG